MSVKWLCLHPADQDVSQMLQELAYAASGRQQPAPTHVDLQQFLGLYLNHRPALQEPSDEVSQAFAALGADSATGMWVTQRVVECCFFACTTSFLYIWQSGSLLYADCSSATVLLCLNHCRHSNSLCKHAKFNDCLSRQQCLQPCPTSRLSGLEECL